MYTKSCLYPRLRQCDSHRAPRAKVGRLGGRRRGLSLRMALSSGLSSPQLCGSAQLSSTGRRLRRRRMSYLMRGLTCEVTTGADVTQLLHGGKMNAHGARATALQSRRSEVYDSFCLRYFCQSPDNRECHHTRPLQQETKACTKMETWEPGPRCSLYMMLEHNFTGNGKPTIK